MGRVHLKKAANGALAGAREIAFERVAAGVLQRDGVAVVRPHAFELFSRATRNAIHQTD